jgi:hypothetical protein
MLEKLAGRLKWERMGDGIRVVIPVRVPWLTAISGIWLFMLPCFITVLFCKLRGITVPCPFTLDLIGLLFVAMWFTMIFTIQHVLTLNPAEMTMQVRMFGIGVRKRTYATSCLYCLRFGPSEYGNYLTMDMMSRIQIDRDGKTRNLAFGITETEADALIEKMMEVYKFPRVQTQ